MENQDSEKEKENEQNQKDSIGKRSTGNLIDMQPQNLMESFKSN